MDFKFDNIDDLKRDRAIEGSEGISIKIKDGIYLHVLAASDANTAWREKAPKVLREIRRLNNAGAPLEQQKQMLAGLYASTLVKFWHGGLDADGKPLPGGPRIAGSPIDFSVDACTAFLVQADDVMDAIEKHCMDTTYFRAARAEKIIETVGNG